MVKSALVLSLLCRVSSGLGRKQIKEVNLSGAPHSPNISKIKQHLLHIQCCSVKTQFSLFCVSRLICLVLSSHG